MLDALRLPTLLRRFARLGHVAAPARPTRRRLLLLQIDGLSSARLVRALGDGTLPRLAARIASGRHTLRRLRTATAPSTPVHQAGLLYGTTAGIPGFGFFDRALGRIVRMDLAEDVEAIERELEARGGPGLLDGGVSYGTIFTGHALDTFFNIVRWGREASSPSLRPPLPHARRNRFDHLASLLFGAAVAGHVAARTLAEFAVGAHDLLRFFRRHHTTRFEWRFLYMRLFVSVILRDMASHGAALDVMRGVPVIYADFLGYDEYAHRRGPDSLLALYNLRGIDEAIDRVFAAVESVPEYGYDVYVFSDHGQSTTIPFARAVGEELAEVVLRNLVGTGTAGAVVDDDIRALVKIRSMRFWAHTLWPAVRAVLEPYLAWLERRAEARLRAAAPDGASVDVNVVTGGTIAHVYLDHGSSPRALASIERRWPALVGALTACPAIGLIVARSDRGPVVLRDGRRYLLGDRAGLAGLAPFRALGVDFLASHLEAAVASPRSGDLVLFGAFARAGNIAFDFEFGSHGGVHPEELDCFLIHPSDVAVPIADTIRAEQLYRFFWARCREGAVDGSDWAQPEQEPAAVARERGQR